MPDDRLIDSLPIGAEPSEIHVPGSIANLGPGFDTLAVAVNLYLSLLVERRRGWTGSRLSLWAASRWART